MNYVRKTYSVPAKRGMRVAWTYRGIQYGKILSAHNGKLWLKLDTGERVLVHPTDGMSYLQ